MVAAENIERHTMRSSKQRNTSRMLTLMGKDTVYWLVSWTACFLATRMQAL
jgi:hypothetical protein